MPLSAILWDLDGTLIHFNIDYKNARSETIRILEKYGYPKGKLNQNYYVLKMIKQATDYFLQEKIHEDDKIVKIKSEVDKKVELIEREASYLATSIPGVKNVLEFCTKRKIKSGIITLNTTKNAILSLKTANLINFFPDTSFIVGRDKVNKNKPDPEHISFIINRLNVSPENICVIGDHPSDIESAHSIGARSIAIISEKHSANEFNTHFFVDQSRIETELIEILKNFIKN
ncbi:HAD family hydrolase [Promethearchaeum syntrophicum]|uniref:HAD family hydrolase n=1 Tax=Promethearchaeum syntrophicum TaxID=2594042 RepID=A0A5B9D6A6_9ARCH|nr:HAD family phosphatase [Candidatus Prometheoarchaeum syntrophicum]QEE14370.1 putative phosphatase [Candidatus Prometheoarchaeum syntrophicum]